MDEFIFILELIGTVAFASSEIMKQTETILVYAGFMHDLEDFFNVFCFHIMIVPL